MSEETPVGAAPRLQPSASYSFTMRLRLPQRGRGFADVAQAIADAEAMLGAIDLVRVEADEVVRDVTVACGDSDHAEAVVQGVRALAGVRVDSVSDRTFLMHKGGKIEVIHAAGGVAVWAHPFWDVADPEEVLRTVRRFAAAGLDGVECFYAEHTREQALLLHDACEARGLLSTGSADFHGPDHEHFDAFRNFELFGRAARLGPIGTG